MAANIIHPYLSTAKDLRFDQDLSWKCEDIPAVGKQNIDQFHAYQRWEIKHGQRQETRSTQRVAEALAEADNYSHISECTNV